jgi:tRNA A-37 threonylcarbamoyl transferase component Bud32
VAQVWELADRYRLVSPLGGGGFSEVWQAEDAVLGRRVAVKLCTPAPAQPDQVQRFYREARTLAGLRHPNVVVVHDAGMDGGTPFVVMELLPGPSLSGLLASQGPLPVGLALRYAEQAAAGLAAAHDAGVVHRDIKPGNLVLADDGTLKVVDFGIARLASDAMSVTATGVTFGTPGYLSPEQAAGNPAEPRSDLYALGCVLFTLLTGQPPFTAEHPVAVAHQHLNTLAPSVRRFRPEVPAAVHQLIATLLAKDPAHRPADAATVRAMLAEARLALGPGGASPRTVPIAAVWHEPAPPDGRPPRGAGRRWLLAATAAAVLVLAVAAGLMLADGWHLVGGAGTPSTPAATQGASEPQPSSPAQPSHHRVTTPAAALDAARLAIVRAENSGQIEPGAAADLQNRLNDIWVKIGQGNLSDAGHKAADLLQRVADLSRNGQISARGVTMLQWPLAHLARLLPTDD